MPYKLLHSGLHFSPAARHINLGSSPNSSGAKHIRKQQIETRYPVKKWPTYYNNISRKHQEAVLWQSKGITRQKIGIVLLS